MAHCNCGLPAELRKRVDVYLALKNQALSLDEIRFVLLDMRSEAFGTPHIGAVRGSTAR